MSPPSQRLQRISISLALTVAVLGGAFFGLSSCGGYVWHHQLFYAVAAITTLCAVVLWRPAAGRAWKVVALVLGLIAIHRTVEAAVAPFYLGAATPYEYFCDAVDAFQNGPC